jgi:lambda family phage portal protein
MSWLAPLVMDVYELDDYEAAVRIVARLQACMGFFIKTENSDQYLSQYTGLGTGQTDVPSGFATASEYGEIPESIDPASVHVLPPGMDAKALTSSQPGPDYEAYVRANLQGQSAGLGVSYQTYSNDYAQSTYSSARNGSLNERRGFRMQQLYLLEKLHGPIWERWCQYLSISGLIPGERDADVPVSWLLPGWPWVDPRNDAAAAKIKICELRTTSRQRAAGDQGDNWHEIATEQEEEERVLKDKGLTTEEKTDASQA